MAVAQHLPQGRSQAGDRHLNFHETRDNLRECLEDLQEWPVDLAKRERRSLNAQVVVLLERVHEQTECERMAEQRVTTTTQDGRRGPTAEQAMTRVLLIERGNSIPG